METQKSETDNKIDDYEVIKQLRKGVFGTSFLVLHRTENKKYVLKKISLAKQTEKSKRIAHQEMNLNAKLSHPYILEYKDAWVDKGNSICIVTDYCEGGDMGEIVQKSSEAYFPEEKLCKWLTQLLLAVEYLHSNRVLHKDLKLRNIFVTNDGDIRIGDFGLAKLLDTEGAASSVVGSPKYMCPELLAGIIPYGYKSDIWSLGFCMFEIAAHQPPFKAPDKTGLINKINRGVLSPLPIIYSSTLKQIIKSMLRKSPEHRPTAAELLRHQHLQLYLLRCHNPSSVFLPVKSPSSTKEKTRPSPGKSNSPKYSRDRQLKQKEKGPILYVNEGDNLQPRNLSDNFNTFKTKLETKRVDPTSYSAKTFQDSEDSKSGEMMSEAALHNDDDQPETVSQKESTTTPNSRGSSSGKTRCFDEESSSSNTQLAKPDTGADPKCYASETENGGECRDVAIDCTPNESNGSFLHKDELEKKEALRELDDKVSQLKALAKLAGDEHKRKPENHTQQRAEALESLLELCAQLLKQEKIDDLAGVLKPFGDDGVSSRETAIWLTKSLMSAQKLAKGS